MRKVLIVAVCLLGVAVGLLALGHQQVSAQNGAPTPTPGPQSESVPSGTRTNSPQALTSKLLSNPYCYQPNPSVDQCFINIRYYQATDNGTSAPYMLRAPSRSIAKCATSRTCSLKTTCTFPTI